MKTKTKKLLFGTIGVLSLCMVSFGFAKSDIPSEYRANDSIQEHIEKISELFLQIDSNEELGEEIENNVFVEVYKNINLLVPYLPQDYKFKLVYAKCKTTSKNLSMGYDYDSLNSFMENCHRPFNSILNTIKNRYTVKAKAESITQSGPAPLLVTFTAKDSVDPSNETIPGDNYYWYYRNINGNDKMIGRGVTIKHNFKQAGTYKVHLTVRSSNHNSKGIFDGEDTITVRVLPKSAQINLVANGRTLRKGERMKFGTQEAQKGIIFDAQSTIPMGGREIISHKWNINGPSGSILSKTVEGKPGYIKVPFQDNGEYKVTITTYDNEKNNISEDYSIVITDPVAIIGVNPSKGDTSTVFDFHARDSYSVISSLKLFTWEIFNEDGEKQDTFQGKNIKKQFKKPGNYTVKLTVEDSLGRTNISTEQLFVESTSPIAQFASEKSNEWKYPSQFMLDGSLSRDTDIDNGFDELSYEWTTSDPQNTIIDDNTNKQTRITFNTVGTHTVTLTVKDKYGKINSITKEFKIISVLRPKIKTSSRAITWDEYVNFIVTSDKDIVSYQWNFGDTDERYVQTNIIKHKYQKVGNYQVKLKVYGKNNMENEVSTLIFVGDKNKPIPTYDVYTIMNSQMLYPKDTCSNKENGVTKEYDAYQVDRYEEFYINAAGTVNSRGIKKDIKYFFKAKDENIFTTNNKFKYKFKKIGCKYIDLTVEDSKLGKTEKKRIRFKVYNSLPKLDNIELHFPQYGNQMGIGFNQNKVKDIFNESFDPLNVKVVAVKPRDDDGYISYYKRYYYRKDDPDRPLEIKITPSTIPYTYFSLPRVPGDFMFGVTLYDNNEGKTKSEDIIGNGPMVVFPSGQSAPDIPIVTVKLNTTAADLGEEVIFDVISKVVSDRPDYDATRVIRYDFEGDGKWDMTTKNDHISHVYTKPGSYTPIVEVSYRGYYTETSTKDIPEINIKDGIKPVVLFDTYADTAIFRSEHRGEIISSDVCFDLVECKQNPQSSASVKKIEEKNFMYTYKNPGKYYFNAKIKDSYANVADKTWELDITTDNKERFALLAIPEYQEIDDEYEILVGKNLDNSILYYIRYTGTGECFVDLDITDTVTKDFACNELHFQKYTPSYKTIQGKIYYTLGNKKYVKSLKVGFLDYAIQLDKKSLSALEKIDTVMKHLDSEKKGDKELRTILENIQKDITNTNKNQANLFALEDFLATNKDYTLSELDKKTLREVITMLSVEDTAGALNTTQYDRAKAEILAITPQIWIKDLEIKFSRLEDNPTKGGEKEYRSQRLDDIGKFLYEKIAKDPEQQKDNQITEDDMKLIIKPNLCTIAEYYNIKTKSCVSGVEVQNPEKVENSTNDSNRKVPGWLKIILIILGILVGGFLVMIIIFAVKARIKSDE